MGVDATCLGCHVTLCDRFRPATTLMDRVDSRDGTGPHFVTQRPNDPGIQRPGDPLDPVTLFYNELQMSTYV